MRHVQGPEAEPGGPPASESAAAQPTGPAPAAPPSGGAGLYDHSAFDPFPRSAGLVSGVVALAVTVAVAGAFWLLNPAVQAGRAGGLPEAGQGQPPAAVAGSPAASASPAAASASPAAAVSGSPAAVSGSPTAGASAKPSPVAPSPSPRSP